MSAGAPIGVSGRSPPGGPLTSPASTDPTLRHTNRTAIPRAKLNRDILEVNRRTMCAPLTVRRDSGGTAHTLWCAVNPVTAIRAADWALGVG